MAGTTSQPSLSALVAALEHTERDTGLGLSSVADLEPYWEAVRRAYAPFESGLPGPTGRVYTHEIPGGQLSNLRQQAIALGLGTMVGWKRIVITVGEKKLPAPSILDPPTSTLPPRRSGGLSYWPEASGSMGPG